MTDEKPFGASAESAQQGSPESENDQEVYFDPDIEASLGESFEITPDNLPPEWTYEPPDGDGLRGSGTSQATHFESSPPKATPSAAGPTQASVDKT
ncbi:MAG: hypothetical protein LBF38_06045, partial [Deltaproteobacteria bacterium]|nr:hypothetical protein [Deltaproteobacteria bacterium]